LGRPTNRASELSLELRVHGVDAIAVAVDGVGVIEEVTVRPIPSLIAASGPYSGAILRSDGSLRLLLDVPVLAARAWISA
jgi:chemotaxis protein histidine kinase CheA